MSNFKEQFEKIYGKESFNDDFTISATAAQNVHLKTMQSKGHPVYVGDLQDKYQWAPAMTWDKLKEYANSLTPEQLKEKVIVWGEDQGFSIQDASGLEEDYYTDDEHSVPVSCFEPMDDDDKLEDHDIMVKGTPRLYTDLWDCKDVKGE